MLQDAGNGEAWQKEILLATSEPIKTETEEAEIKLADGANSGNSNIFTCCGSDGVQRTKRRKGE
jgi:hypothetical protein